MGLFSRFVGWMNKETPADAPDRPEQEHASPPSETAHPPVPTGIVISGRGGVDVPAIMLPAGAGYVLEIVGESHYQDTLVAMRVDSGGEREHGLQLVAEIDNPHDAMAVSVRTFSGDIVGYLPREYAPKYHSALLPLVSIGVAAAVSGKLVGGTQRKKTIGVYIDVGGPRSVADAISDALSRGQGARP